MNQLLLGTESVAPGTNPMRESVLSIPNNLEIKEEAVSELPSELEETDTDEPDDIASPPTTATVESEENVSQSHPLREPTPSEPILSEPILSEPLLSEPILSEVTSPITESESALPVAPTESAGEVESAAIDSQPNDQSNSNAHQKRLSVSVRSLKLPDINDNHSLTTNAKSQSRKPVILRTGKMSDLKRAQLRNQFIKESMVDSVSSESPSEDSWTVEVLSASDVFPEVQQVSAAKCIPRWRKRESPEMPTEEELCSDEVAQLNRISTSDLEKRQVLVDSILRADETRLDEILTHLMQHQ